MVARGGEKEARGGIMSRQLFEIGKGVTFKNVGRAYPGKRA